MPGSVDLQYFPEPTPPGMVLVKQRPAQEPEAPPEQSEEGRRLVQISRRRRSLSTAVEDLCADVATQRDNVRAAAAMFGSPQYDGTDQAEQATALQTTRLNGLLSELTEARAAFQVFCEQNPTEAELQERLEIMRKREHQEKRSEVLTSYTTLMETALAHVLEAEAALGEASKIVANESRFFKNPVNARELTVLCLDRWQDAKTHGGARWIRDVLARQI